MRDNCLVLSMVLCLGTPAVSQTASPAVSDPAPDAAHPAAMDAFVLPAPNGSMNALMYQAAGGGPHPTLLLLHGFPGNELHYRGSWGSRGVFSFANAATDARIALRYLRRPEIVAQYRIDPRRIAIAGHSMGGFMAADAAADDKGVVGLFLIDAWNIGAEASQLGTSVGREVWHKKAVRNLPPLAGTSEEALLREMLAGQDRFDLNSRIAAFGNRPLAIYGASRGGGEANGAYVAAAKAAGNTIITSAIWPTDHSFSDKRVALAKALVAWLDTLPARSR
jgi:pimeloyl-ACP methyl ester carboxylesterase